MDTRVNRLILDIENFRNLNRKKDDLINIKNSLNSFFNPINCKDFILTNNYDKIPFGCIVFPEITQDDIDRFIINGENLNISNYCVELDTKMFDCGLTNEDIAQMILYNVYHMVKDTQPCKNIKYSIDSFFLNNANNLIIDKYLMYKQIFILGVCDALNISTSCLYLPDEIMRDPFLESLELDGFKQMLDKIYHNIPGCEIEINRMPKLSILEWCLRLYDKIDTERIPALHLLDKAKSITASKLYIDRFNSVIKLLNDVINESGINESNYITESKNKIGLASALKYNGLRNIENDLYEFRIRVKNSDSENDIMYALKQINLRLSILDDYIRRNADTDTDIDRWIGVKIEYMNLRDMLSKKNINNRNYGIFVDYDSID